MSKYTDLKTKKAKMEYLKEKLSTDARWAVRGLLKIYEFQTDDEQTIGCTVEFNNVGYSGCDSDILSSFAEQVLKGRKLSEKQMAIVFKKIPKYRRQLMDVADARG
jgi:hypothetical protein